MDWVSAGFSFCLTTAGDVEFCSYWNFKVYEIQGVWTSELGFSSCWRNCDWTAFWGRGEGDDCVTADEGANFIVGIGLVLVVGMVWLRLTVLDTWLAATGAGCGNCEDDTGLKNCWLEVTTCLFYTILTWLLGIGNWDADLWLTIVGWLMTIFWLLLGTNCELDTICFWDVAGPEFGMDAWDGRGACGFWDGNWLILIVLSAGSVATLAGTDWDTVWYPGSTLTWVLVIVLAGMLNCFSDALWTILACLIGCYWTVTAVGVGTVLTLLSTGTIFVTTCGWNSLTWTFLLNTAVSGTGWVRSCKFGGWVTTFTYSANLGVGSSKAGCGWLTVLDEKMLTGGYWV